MRDVHGAGDRSRKDRGSTDRSLPSSAPKAIDIRRAQKFEVRASGSVPPGRSSCQMSSSWTVSGLLPGQSELEDPLPANGLLESAFTPSTKAGPPFLLVIHAMPEDSSHSALQMNGSLQIGTKYSITTLLGSSDALDVTSGGRHRTGPLGTEPLSKPGEKGCSTHHPRCRSSLKT